MSENGIVRVPSAHDFPATVARLEAAIVDAGLTLMAKVDHAGNAARHELSLRPTTLFLFGSPKAGTPLMAAAASFGLDLPQKALVVAEDEGQVAVLYNDPAYLAARHGVDAEHPVLAKVVGVLATLAAKATS